MYPDLSYLFYDLFGTAPDNAWSLVKTFGLMLVLAILTAAYMLRKELIRKEKEGVFHGIEEETIVGAPAGWYELVSNGFFGFILGFKGLYAVINMAEMQADPGGVVFSTKGNLLGGIIGLVLFAGLKWWEKNKQKLPKPKTVNQTVMPHHRIGDITMVAAVFGVIGAKVFDIIENLPAFFRDPIGMFFSGSGLTIYGGLIFGFLGLVWYLRKYDITLLPFLDAVAPGYMAAYGVGRIGCQLSGDGDWGIVSGATPSWWFLPDWMWGFTYPHNVAEDGVKMADCTFRYCMELPAAVFPTPFYETVMALSLAAILWSMRKRIKVPGVLFALFLICNGLERLLIETIRVNDRYNVFGFNPSQAQIIAVGLIAAGFGLIWWFRSQKRTA